MAVGKGHINAPELRPYRTMSSLCRDCHHGHAVVVVTAGQLALNRDGACRYTTIKSGRRRLLVPNSAFITREFMILDDAPDNGSVSPRRGAEMAPPSQPQQQVASYPVAPPQPQHQQPVPHDWVQRTLEAEPFHRDSSQPVHMPAGSHQQATPADSNGGCALVISTRSGNKACKILCVGMDYYKEVAGVMLTTGVMTHADSALYRNAGIGTVGSGRSRMLGRWVGRGVTLLRSSMSPRGADQARLTSMETVGQHLPKTTAGLSAASRRSTATEPCLQMNITKAEVRHGLVGSQAMDAAATVHRRRTLSTLSNHKTPALRAELVRAATPRGTAGVTMGPTLNSAGIRDEAPRRTAHGERWRLLGSRSAL